MQFSIFSKNSLYTLQKIELAHNRISFLKSRFLDTPRDFLMNFFSSRLISKDGCILYIIKSAGSQTVWLLNSTKLLSKNVSLKRLQPEDPSEWRQMVVLILPSTNKVLLTAIKNCTESDLKVFQFSAVLVCLLSSK